MSKYTYTDDHMQQIHLLWYHTYKSGLSEGDQLGSFDSRTVHIQMIFEVVISCPIRNIFKCFLKVTNVQFISSCFLKKL